MTIPTQDELYAAGAHVGYSRSRRHPSVMSSLFGMKHRTDIIDLAKTGEQISAAREFLLSVLASGKNVLLIGTKPEVKRVVQEHADTLGLPSVTKRWVGGTLTNFKQIRARVDMLEDLQARKEAGTLIYRTKKELLMIDRKIEKLDRNFGGIRTLKNLPGAIVVVDPKKEHLAVAEARVLGIPIVALANTDCDISILELPIMANDASFDSVTLVMNALLGELKK